MLTVFQYTSINNITIDIIMSNRIFRNYNRVKYLMRVKHWRGRSIHSPFLYNVIRGGFMKNDDTGVDKKLYSDLLDKNFTVSHTQVICRLYSHLNYTSYTFDSHNYNGEDMVIIAENIDIKPIVTIADSCNKEQTVCVVVNSIYKTRQRYHLWKLLSLASRGVAVDLYHTGYLFLDRHLNRQNFKMRF